MLAMAAAINMPNIYRANYLEIAVHIHHAPVKAQWYGTKGTVVELHTKRHMLGSPAGSKLRACTVPSRSMSKPAITHGSSKFQTCRQSNNKMTYTVHRVCYMPDTA